MKKHNEMVKAPKRRKGFPCEKEEGVRIPINFCLDSDCEFLDLEHGFCDKYVEQARVRHKAPPHRINETLRTPSSGNRGWYGKKNIRTGGFA